MKLIFDKPLGNGNPYAPSQKCIWGALIGAGASLLGNMLGSEQQAGYTKEQQKLQSKLNREEQTHSMALQKNYQDMLWNQGTAKAVSGMKNAGLNPAMAGGSSLGGASGSGGLAKPSSGSSGPSASSGSPLGSQAVSAAADIQRVKNETDVAQSQVKLNDSAAALNNKKAGLTQKDIESYGDRLQAELENKRAITAWYGQDTENKKEELNNIKLKGNEIQENINKIRQDVKESVEREKWTREQRVQYKNAIAAQIKLAFSQAHYYDSKASIELQDCLFRWTTSTSEADKADAERGLTQVITRLTQKYGDAEHIIDMIDQVVGRVSDTILDVGLAVGTRGAGRGFAAAGKIGKYGAKAIKYVRGLTK